MTGKSGIQWTSSTWNPLTGCTRVTSGCDNCYAFALHDQRYRAYVQYEGIYPKNGKSMPLQYSKPFSTIQLLPDRLEDPLHVKQPQMFFVNSMSDLFHSQVPDAYIVQIFETMRKADWHIFQILTKRPGRLRRLGQQIQWPTNVWAGVSIELDTLVARADALREIDASVKFLSCEPLLGPLPSLRLEGIDWVIVGGESGPQARRMQEVWATDLRDRCVAADLPFFFKQWGGKTAKAGGNLLQGEIWEQMPKVYER